MKSDYNPNEIITIPIAVGIMAITGACVWYLLSVCFLWLYVGSHFTAPSLGYFFKTFMVLYMIVFSLFIYDRIRGRI